MILRFAPLNQPISRQCKSNPNRSAPSSWVFGLALTNSHSFAILRSPGTPPGDLSYWAMEALGHSSLSQPVHIAMALDPYAPTWIEISKDNFDHNVATYRKILGPSTRLFVVLKANAYGHGLMQIAQLCAHNDQINGVCVFLASDAVLLRHAGFGKPIVVIGHADADLKDIVGLDIALCVHSVYQLAQIQQAAAALNTTAAIHMKIETGLSRLGLFTSEALHVIDHLLPQYSNIKLAGVFSHFAESDAHDRTFTEGQIAVFQDFINQLGSRRVLDDLLIHLCNSTGVLRLPHVHNSMVRCGGGIWGIAKSDKIKAEVRQNYPAFNLRPVMCWKSRIISLKWVEAGASISYACTYRTTRRSLIAVAPVGYYDGYQRRLSNKGYVLVDRQVARVVGRVGMNALMIDVTDAPETSLSSEVMLLGNHPLVHPEYLAEQMGTISYELMVGIPAHIPRYII